MNKQRGQALVEHIILWPSLVLLTLGTLQMAFLYRDRATFNDAVFRAAREGSLQNAFEAPMNQKLVESLVPLYLRRDPGIASYAGAFARAYTDNAVNPLNGRKLRALSGIDLEIVSPNRDVFDRFARNMYTLENGCEQDVQRVSRGNDRTRCREVQFRQIPNDNLNIREDATESVTIAGESVELNIQDANLLKIRGHWCAPLVVPFGRDAFYWARRTWHALYSDSGGRSHDHWRACQNRTRVNAIAASSGLAWRTLYIPVTSDSIVRMQSPVRCEGDQVQGRIDRCQNLD